MSNITLYIAMSLDGYISDKSGYVSWLCGDGSNPQDSGTYNDFINTIDTVIMGYKTYNQIITELSPDNWVYPDKHCYVITGKEIINKENISFENNLIKLVKDLKKENKKGVWICGGASIVNQLINQNLIDKFIIALIPTLLGDGIKLFSINNNELKLKLLSTKTFNGIVEIEYEPR